MPARELPPPAARNRIDRESEDISAFPLAWPLGWPRSKHRTRARFGGTKVVQGTTTSWKQRRELTLAEGRDRLLDELDMLGAEQVVISSNARVRQDGELHGQQSNPIDPGAAVYFRLNRQPRVLACDRWDRLADNLAALAAHIQAIRGIDRWGVGSLEQAFAGYRALSAVGEKKPWWVMLGLRDKPAATARTTVEAKYHELMQRHHPDRGGNPNQAAEVTAAWMEARQAMDW
jgi:hypothetical protein